MRNPRAIIVSGANGAGKTTFARQFLPLLHPGAPFVNADEIQRQGGRYLQPIAAAKELLRRLAALEEARLPFAVETTLSSRTYIPRLRQWRQFGYKTVLHFIEVPSADFAVKRVAARVAAGGHPIAEADIRRRFERGRRLFHDMYRQEVHQWYHWYSDDDGIRLMESREQV